MYTIYRITNVINNKSYIGYTTKTVKRRWANHRSSSTYGSGYYVHNAIRKYGIDNFSFDVLCWGVDHEAGLKIAEPLMIELFKPEYNMTPGGEGVMIKGRVPWNKGAHGKGLYSEESLQRMRLAAAGRNKGRIHTDVARKNMKLAAQKRPPKSSEHRRNIGLAQLGRIQSPETIEKRKLTVQMKNWRIT